LAGGGGGGGGRGAYFDETRSAPFERSKEHIVSTRKIYFCPQRMEGGLLDMSYLYLLF
jgi:hypothetical protein